MYTWVESRKQLKRNHILDLIRRSPTPLSRHDIKKLTEYSMTTVSTFVTDLIREGFLLEDACVDAGRVGRKPIFLRLNSSGGYFVGIEFNIEQMHCAILDFVGDTIYTANLDIPSSISRDLLIELIFQETQKCLDFLGPRKNKLLGIGLGLPGYIDAAAGVTLTWPHLADWVNIPIVQLMEERFGYYCCIGNNVSVMGLVFKWLRKYHEDNDFLLISIRSGVRCIPFLNQQPYSGRYSSTGEIGHLKVGNSPRLCDCGRTGCLNTEVSDVAIRAILEDGFLSGKYNAVRELAAGARPTSSMLVKAALSGDTESIQLVSHAGKQLGVAVAAAANLFAPQKIILSGTLIGAGSPFFSALEETVQAQCLPAVMENLTISPSPFGNNIGALGAATLTLERKFNPISPLNAL